MSNSDSPPLVSVVTPIYNRTVYLGATIEGVLCQTCSDWELIVVDDGSEEDVAGFLRRYLDGRIMFLRQANQGNAAARNTGIREARGECVICLDSDDVWHPDLLQACVAALESSPDVDVAYTQVQRIDAEGKALPGPVRSGPQHGDLLEPLLMGFPILPSSALVRRRCFERWGMYTPGLDDWELWLRWAARGCRFQCIEKPLLYYRIHDQNLNLDWSRRRGVHFATLDTFYQQQDLPVIAIQMRNRAYARQHFHFAVLAWQVGRSADGLAEFGRAVRKNPGLLHDLDFHTSIACAHQGRVKAGTPRGLDLATAESTLVESLDTLFAQVDLPSTIRQNRRSAYGWAYLALARLAYGVSQNMAYTRRFLLHSLAAWPSAFWQTDWALWLMRGVVGYKIVRRLKHLLYENRIKVQHASS